MNISLVLKKANNKNIILNEINIQSRICHPNIIQLYNYFKDKDNANYFLILEYANKGTLFDLIRCKKGLNEINTFYYFIQAVNAIYFLHNNQIIHRDLKPENLLINKDNILKLCDFGWSVYLYNNKRETFCGTVEYMAPEIVKNQGYDFSIDVWSLGVLLYELIHSYSPFVVKDLDIYKIENNIVTKELQFKKGISNECKDLIKQLLAKDVKNRIKVKDIYQHPFVLRYVNMINNYLNINQLNNKNINNNNIKKENNDNKIVNKVINNEFKNENKNNKNKYLNLNESHQTFNEFDTIPNEPEPKKIEGNFDRIVRKFTKISDKIEEVKNKNKIETIKNNLDKKINNTINHKKTFSLINLNYQEVNVNEDDQKLKNDKKKIENVFNIENFLIKESIENDSNNKQQERLSNIQHTLIESYNNNLIKTNYKNNKKSRIKQMMGTKIRNINTSSKKSLINSYKVKKNNKNENIIKKQLINNYTSTNIHNSSNIKYPKENKRIINSKSISFIKFNNKSFHNFSLYSKPNNKINIKKIKNINNIKSINKKIKRKKTSLIKHINTLSKKSNYSFNDINKLNLGNNSQKKLTLNLSNINVINVYNNSSINDINPNILNVPKIVQKVNTFFIRDKPKKQYIFPNRNNNINKKNITRLNKSKQYCLNIKKSNVEFLYNSERKRIKSPNSLKKKQSKFFCSTSNNNKTIVKTRMKSSRNIKINNNPIPSLNLNLKK